MVEFFGADKNKSFWFLPISSYFYHCQILGQDGNATLYCSSACFATKAAPQQKMTTIQCVGDLRLLCPFGDLPRKEALLYVAAVLYEESSLYGQYTK